jgi:hypothetical protein
LLLLFVVVGRDVEEGPDEDLRTLVSLFS